MPEPTTSSMAGAVAAFKALGGTAAAVASGATLAAVVVMIMTPPRDKREWTVGLISTVVSSIGGGAVTVEHFQLHHWAFSTMGLCALGGQSAGHQLWRHQLLFERAGGQRLGQD
jgi:hypothetical protein